MLVGTVSSEACLCDTEADGFLVVRHHKACAHVTGEAQSSHVRNAPINASEQTETVSLASKVIGPSAFPTAGGGGGWGGGAGQTIQKAALYGLLS